MVIIKPTLKTNDSSWIVFYFLLIIQVVRVPKLLISLCAAIFLLISWLVPHHYYPWLTGLSEFSAFTAALILSLVLFKTKIVLPRAALLFALTALIPLIQWLSNIIYFFGDAIIVSGYLLGFATMMMVGYNLTLNPSSREKSYQGIAAVFIIGAALSTWIALRQWLGLNQGFSFFEAASSSSRPFANFGQPNNLATLLCIGLASTLYLFELKRLGVLASSVLAGFLLFGLVLTQSRTPWVGAIFMLAWWAWKSRFFSSRLSWLGVAGWVAAFAICTIALPLLTSTVSSGQSSINLIKHAQAFERGSLWAQFGLAVLHGPLWGYGWNQVSVAQLDISNLFPLGMRTNSSHNILLDLLIWNGPILGGLIIVSLAAWLCRLAYSARTLGTVYALLAVGFALIHGMLEFPLTYAYFLLPVGLLIGMIYGELSTAPDYTQKFYTAKLSRLPRFSGEIPKAAFASFIVVCTLLMSWIGFEYNTINDEYRTFRPTAMTTRGTPISTESPSPIFLLTQLRDYMHLQSISPTPNMTEEQLDWTREVAYRFPQVTNLTRYATALVLNNQPIQAGLELGKLRILYGDGVFTQASQALMALQQQYADQDKATYRKYWHCQRHPHGEGCT